MVKQIPSLNGLRALSILGVLIAHIQIASLHMADGIGGQLGVNIFFIISGFLITFLLIKEETANGSISLRNFYIRRSLRIFPVFYFMLVVYYLLQLAGILDISLSGWLSSITYTKYFFPPAAKDDWVTGHIWSLSVEEHFYFIWPIVFTYFKKFRKLFAVIIIIVIPLVRLFSDIPVMHLFTRADALMWGCLFALYYQNILKFVTDKSTVILLIPFILLGLCLLSKKVLPIANLELRKEISLAFFGSFGSITNLCIGFIIIISITFKNNIYFAILNSWPMNFIGKLSYSIYIWQQLFFSDNVKPLSNLPINLFLILGVSIISYYLIEMPFLRLKNQFSKKPPPDIE